MHRIINGSVYDTDEASLLHHWHKGDQGEVLFADVRNNYFLVSYGPVTQTLVPLSLCWAIDWAEKRCPPLVEELFGVMHEAGEGPPYTAKPGTAP